VDWSRHLCGTLNCPPFLWGPLCMCVLHCSEGKRGMSIAELLPVESVHLAHSQRLHFHQRHWNKLNCSTQDYWLFGGKVEYVTPLAHLQDLPQQNRRQVRHHYQCQETVQLFRWTVRILAFCLAGSFYNNTHSRTIKWLLVVKQSETESLSLTTQPEM